MNKIWMFIVVLCFAYAFFTGNIGNLTESILDVPNKTLTLLITVGSLIIIYNGIFNIAIESGMIDLVGKLFKWLSYLLFPKIPKDSIIHNYICSNITANLLGLGIASTPIAMQTIREMKKLNNNSDVASKEMVTLLVLNITCFTLFPLTVISIREKYNSNLGIQIWITLLIITFITSVLSLITNNVLQRMIKWDI